MISSVDAAFKKVRTFYFLIVGIGAEPAAEEIETRIIAAIDRTGLPGSWSGEVHLGVATSDEWTIDELVAAADTAMYSRRQEAG